jgi:hypothetical protein
MCGFWVLVLLIKDPFWVLVLLIKDPFWVLANTKTQKVALIILIIFSHLGGKLGMCG